jgi:hypothetical protein
MLLMTAVVLVPLPSHDTKFIKKYVNLISQDGKSAGNIELAGRVFSVLSLFYYNILIIGSR